MTSPNGSARLHLPPYMTLGENFGAKLLLREPETHVQPDHTVRYFFCRRGEMFKEQFGGKQFHDLPGGLMLPGERLETAAAREASEELKIAVNLDVDEQGNPIVLDEEHIHLQFQEGPVDLLRKIISGQALGEPPEELSREHEPGSGLWLSLHEAVDTLDFGPRLGAALQRIMGKIATGSMVEPPHI